MKNAIPVKSSGLFLLLWITALSISLLFNPIAANAQITSKSPTDTLDPALRSKTSAPAQNVTYLDANYKPATAATYTYKRVIKYEGPVLNSNLAAVWIDGVPHYTINPQQTGIQSCSLVDYYRTGERVRVVSLISNDKTCSQWAFDGKEILYYKNGRVKQEANYEMGKLHGKLIAYDENGNETKREDYDHSVLIEADRWIIGTWKYEGYFVVQRDIAGVKVPSSIGVKSTFIYSQDGVVESTHLIGWEISRIKGNWKYIPKDASSGVLEEYQGEKLIERGMVKWLSRDQLEYTITFSPNSNALGKQFVWTRQ